jgi:hypothetical protein
MKRQMRRRIVRERSAQFVWLELRLASKERAKREKAKMTARLTASLSKDSDDEVQQRNPCKSIANPMCAIAHATPKQIHVRPTPITNPGMDG